MSDILQRCIIVFEGGHTVDDALYDPYFEEFWVPAAEGCYYHRVPHCVVIKEFATEMAA